MLAIDILIIQRKVLKMSQENFTNWFKNFLGFVFVYLYVGYIADTFYNIPIIDPTTEEPTSLVLFISILVFLLGLVIRKIFQGLWEQIRELKIVSIMQGLGKCKEFFLVIMQGLGKFIWFIFILLIEIFLAIIIVVYYLFFVIRIPLELIGYAWEFIISKLKSNSDSNENHGILNLKKRSVLTRIYRKIVVKEEIIMESGNEKMTFTQTSESQEEIEMFLDEILFNSLKENFKTNIKDFNFLKS